jgi:hypothetical protein
MWTVFKKILKPYREACKQGQEEKGLLNMSETGLSKD